MKAVFKRVIFYCNDCPIIFTLTYAEFFQYIVKEMFEEQYGLFIQNPDSRLSWFSIDPSRDAASIDEYMLLGKLMGLAVYNGVILDIHFPTIIFKELLDEDAPIDIEDLKEYDPVRHFCRYFLIDHWQILGKNLEELLNSEEDIESTYGHTFQIQSSTRFGQIIDVELIENGENIPVTNENRFSECFLFNKLELTYRFC